MEAKGEIFKIFENETKKKETYYKFKVNNIYYSAFEQDLSFLKIGDLISFTVVNKGKYHNAINVKKIKSTPTNTYENYDQKDLRIVRQSSLKSAVELIKSTDSKILKGRKLTEVAIDISDIFVRYVYHGKNNNASQTRDRE